MVGCNCCVKTYIIVPVKRINNIFNDLTVSSYSNITIMLLTWFSPFSQSQSGSNLFLTSGQVIPSSGTCLVTWLIRVPPTLKLYIYNWEGFRFDWSDINSSKLFVVVTWLVALVPVSGIFFLTRTGRIVFYSTDNCKYFINASTCKPRCSP